MSKFVVAVVLLTVMLGCGKTKKSSTQPANIEQYGSFGSNGKALVQIKTYDPYNQETGVVPGIFIDKNLIITNLDGIKGCFRAKVAALGSDEFSDIEGYLAYNHKSNLVLLRSFVRTKTPVKVYPHTEPADSFYTLSRKDGKLFAQKLTALGTLKPDSVTFTLTSGEAPVGQPAFNYNHQLCGFVQEQVINGTSQKTIVPATAITQLLNSNHQLKSVFDLSTKSSKTYPSYKSIKGFKIVTTMGNIHISLSNETPQYRDNFIRLVSDGFYDSLLVHRVIKGFLIQTGAADSRHAKHDDVVGWQGPGYTLPVITKPTLYHKRGAIAASKLPADRNPKNRCDGSQFYIVSGRIFSHTELDDLEKKNNRKFTAEQRETYTKIGGAPYLDGDYTVFGEVTSGMDVVDKIANVETYNVDRPLKNIRVVRIEIMR